MEPVESEVVQPMFLAHPDKFSHASFFRDRNWKVPELFWNSLIKNKGLPNWVLGDSTYGVADLQAVHDCAQVELSNPRNQRKTFAVRIGYAGTAYQGYQSQGRTSTSVRTVEDDVREALGRSIVGAGRTDKVLHCCVTWHYDITQMEHSERIMVLPVIYRRCQPFHRWCHFIQRVQPLQRIRYCPPLTLTLLSKEVLWLSLKSRRFQENSMLCFLPHGEDICTYYH